jgi:hypothetical protein
MLEFWANSVTTFSVSSVEQLSETITSIMPQPDSMASICRIIAPNDRRSEFARLNVGIAIVSLGTI